MLGNPAPPRAACVRTVLSSSSGRQTKRRGTMKTSVLGIRPVPIPRAPNDYELAAWKEVDRLGASHAVEIETHLGRSGAERFYSCGRTVVCREDLETAQLSLLPAWHCGMWPCPTCENTRKRDYEERVQQAAVGVAVRHLGVRWLFLLLSVKNCPVSEIRATSKRMCDAFAAMTRRPDWPGVASIRCLQLQRADDDSANVHLHNLVAVTGSYFAGRNYLSKKRWEKMWREELGDDDPLFVDVENVRGQGVLAAMEVASCAGYTQRAHPPADILWRIRASREMLRVQRVRSYGDIKIPPRRKVRSALDKAGRTQDRKVSRYTTFGWKDGGWRLNSDREERRDGTLSEAGKKVAASSVEPGGFDRANEANLLGTNELVHPGRQAPAVSRTRRRGRAQLVSEWSNGASPPLPAGEVVPTDRVEPRNGTAIRRLSGRFKVPESASGGSGSRPGGRLHFDEKQSGGTGLPLHRVEDVLLNGSTATPSGGVLPIGKREGSRSHVGRKCGRGGIVLPPPAATVAGRSTAGAAGGSARRPRRPQRDARPAGSAAAAGRGATAIVLRLPPRI
jgi:hypothetical protein